MGPRGMNVLIKGTTDPDRMLQAEPNVTKRRHEIRLRQDANGLRIWDLRPMRARPYRAAYRASILIHCAHGPAGPCTALKMYV